MDAEKLASSFVSPPAEYRPAPFFVFNDEHEGLAGETRITRVLEDYRRLGYGGAFLHPRPGLITEYLSPRWFELIRHAVGECGRLGLVPYFYDENSYPSGFAGGHVAARAPETRTRYVTALFGRGPGQAPEDRVALYRWEGNQPGAAVIPAEIEAGQPWVAFVMETMRPVAWHGETICPDLLHPRTTEAFLESTYDAYHDALGELWPRVPAMFTDEPHLPAQGHGAWSQGLHLSPYLFGEFEQRLGYDLRRHLDRLYFDVGDFRAVRFDLYELMHQLWMENWALPVEQWCDDHGIALTGHYLEHEWPCPYSTPGHVHLLAHMHWPGTDMLETFLLTGHASHDVQNFAPVPDGQEPHGLVYLHQVHSVANQLGKSRVLDECWGAGGNDSTPADWSRIGRWLIVHGVNLLNPHLSFLTIRGTRKADHPQTFSDHSPWFEYLGPINDELSRLCWASNQGRIEQRILLLDPLTTGYCVARKSDLLPLPFAGEGGAEGNTAAELPDENAIRSGLSSFFPLQRDVGDIAQGLSDAQADFDLGDEYVIEEFGRADGGSLVVGEQTYRLLVWPGCMTNLRSATARTLEAYLAGGGMIVGVRPEAVTVDGRPSEFLVTWESHFPDQIRWFDDNGTLIEAVLADVPPRLWVETPPPTGLAHMRRVVSEGELLVVVNSSASALDSAFRVETSRQHLYELNPGSGASHVVATERDGTSLRGRLRLEPRRAIVLLATDEEITAAPGVPEIRVGESGTPLRLTGVIRREPNVLAVDYCELEVNGQTAGPESVYAANNRLWRAHGFETNGWSGVIQFRDQMVAQYRRMRPESGGVVTYRVQIADGVETKPIRLAVETPDLWQVEVNGQPVDVESGEQWLDVHIRAVAVGHLLRQGENVVRITGRPFDVRREIDQIYLLGDFACVSTTAGFRLEPAKPLQLGSWREQGHPFYEREVEYSFELPAGAGRGVLMLDDGDWAGTVLLVNQSAEFVAQLWETPFSVVLDAARGRLITVRVVGSPKNLLGPWHDTRRLRKVAWMPMWFGRDVPTTPQAGANYDLLDLGLFREPRWFPAGD